MVMFSVAKISKIEIVAMVEIVCMVLVYHLITSRFVCLCLIRYFVKGKGSNYQVYCGKSM